MSRTRFIHSAIAIASAFAAMVALTDFDVLAAPVGVEVDGFSPHIDTPGHAQAMLDAAPYLIISHDPIDVYEERLIAELDRRPEYGRIPMDLTRADQITRKPDFALSGGDGFHRKI